MGYSIGERNPLSLKKNHPVEGAGRWLARRNLTKKRGKTWKPSSGGTVSGSRCSFPVMRCGHWTAIGWKRRRMGTNIDVLRPRGALVRTAGVESSGSASFMEVFSTVNLPPETPLSAVDHLYRKAWESGCKGITVFREGTRASVLEVSGRDGVYRAEAGAPLGVCTFCEVPVPKGAA